jgi:hypothetical protein
VRWGLILVAFQRWVNVVLKAETNVSDGGSYESARFSKSRERSYGRLHPGKVSWIFPLERISADWRMFEVTTRVQILKPSGSAQVWLPAALLGETPYHKVCNL